MKTCEYAGDPFTEPRSHPWLGSVGDTTSRYYDLTATPSHVRRSLEDFRPWDHYPAIEDFYALLERINQPESALESNDSAFTGPQASSGDQPFECSGRVMVLFRALTRNTAEGVEALKNRLHGELVELDPDFRWGIIGTTLIPVRYLALPPGGQQLGWQLMISFWAWGDSEADNMLNLRRLFANLSQALCPLLAVG